MPGLIQRHNAVEEYAALISTNASSAHRRRGRRLEHSIAKTSNAGTTLSDEAEEWYEAVCPPLEDVQDFIRRFHADPDFSQDRVFAFLAPLFAFGVLFVVAVVAVQPHSFAHRILDAARDHTAEDVLKVGGMLLGGILLSLVALKCVIWGVAEGASVVLSMENRDERGRREEAGIPSSGMVLGGMLM
ncbi:hypothetical protein C8Q79DRAFT_1014220 [Trametes meyenii]|nr:hypothetical protein C8Q79DRAFT_1014220 [Trametes meyenii]